MVRGKRGNKEKRLNLVKFLIIGLLTLLIIFFAVKLLSTGKVTYTQPIDNSPPLCTFHFRDNVNLVDTNMHAYKLIVNDLYRSESGWSGDRLSFVDFYSGNSLNTTFKSNTSRVSTGFITLGGNSYTIYLEGTSGINVSKYNVTILSVNGTSISCVSSCAPTTCSALGYTCGTWNNGTCGGILGGILNCGICGKGLTCVNGNCSIYVPTPVPITGNVGTISKGTYNKINGVSIFVTDILQNSSFPNQTFITFIAGSEMNLTSINSPANINLNGKIYTLKLISVSDTVASINIFTNSKMGELEQIEKNIPSNSTRTETEQIEKNKYLPYNNFTDLDSIHKGEYVIIGNGSNKEVLKLFDVGYSLNASQDFQLALFSYVFKGWLTNITWSGWGGTFPSGNIYRGGFIVLSDNGDVRFYITVIQGNAGLDSYSYNVSIEPYVYPPRYVFYRGYSVIYKTMNNPVIFVKDTNSTNSSSIITGTEMFLSSDSNKTKFVISGSNYSIELVASNSTDATFNITNIGSGALVDNTPTGCTPGTTKQKDCNSQNTACIAYSSVTATCLPSGVWNDPSCNLTVYSKRGTDCNGDGWHACDGSGNCQGWSGTGCGSCPWGVGGYGCNIDTSKYTFNIYGLGNTCWVWKSGCPVSPICHITAYGLSHCCRRDTDYSWAIKPK